MGRGNMIFRYSDCGGSFLSVGLYVKKRLVKKQVFCFSPDEIFEGVPVSADNLAERIRASFSRACDFTLVISSSKVFKTSTAVPLVGEFKSNAIRNNEILKDYPDYKKKYLTVSIDYDYDGGRVLSDYFIYRGYADFFKSLAAKLGVRCRGYNLFGNYLFYNLDDISANSYAFLYEELGAATLIVVNKNQLLAAVDFPYQRDALQFHRYLSIGNCERFIEGHKIEKFYVCSDEDIKIDGAEIYDLDFSQYNYSGFKIR